MVTSVKYFGETLKVLELAPINIFSLIVSGVIAKKIGVTVFS